MIDKAGPYLQLVYHDDKPFGFVDSSKLLLLFSQDARYSDGKEKPVDERRPHFDNFVNLHAAFLD